MFHMIVMLHILNLIRDSALCTAYGNLSAALSRNFSGSERRTPSICADCHMHRAMPIPLHLISTGCHQDDNALLYLPSRIPMASLIFARLDLNREGNEPDRGGRYLETVGCDGNSQRTKRRHRMQAMYEYSFERWVRPVADKILHRAQLGGDIPAIFVIVACSKGHHRSVSTVEHLLDDFVDKPQFRVYVWHWSYICETPGFLETAKRFMSRFLKEYFPENFFPFDDPDVDDQDKLIQHGIVVTVTDSTAPGGKLRAWGYIEYASRTNGFIKIFWHSDDIVNWHRASGVLDRAVLPSLRGVLVQFTEGVDIYRTWQPKALQIHIFFQWLAADELTTCPAIQRRLDDQ